MEDYRVFLIGPDGVITSRVDLVCENEEEARERAKQLAQGCTAELWQSTRKIAEYRSPN